MGHILCMRSMLGLDEYNSKTGNVPCQKKKKKKKKKNAKK